MLAVNYLLLWFSCTMYSILVYINPPLDSYLSSISRSNGGNRVTEDDEEEGYPVEDKLNLFSDLSEIGDWDGLCTFLGVKDTVMNALRVSSQIGTQKKQDCLTSYRC